MARKTARAGGVGAWAYRPMRSLMTPRSMSWFLRRVADHAERVETLLHSFDLLSEKLAQLDDPLITDAEMLGGTIGKPTLSFPRHGILCRHHVHTVFARLRF